jgi:methionyl-tRNA formyltransferase
MSVFKMEHKKKILVLCGGKFALGALQKLAFEQYLCGIAIGKGQDSVVKSLENASLGNKIPFKHFPTKKSVEELGDWIRSIQPDYIFSISFPFLLTEEVLSYGEKKFINLHLGPLPAYRGPMPIFEVLRYQEKETAIAVHYMNKEFDEGSLIFNDLVQISPTDTFGILATKLSSRAANTALNLANMLEYASQIPASEQDEHLARYFEFPEEQDTFVNWKNMSATEIVALINACNPWNSGADAYLNDQLIKLVSASSIELNHNHVPGSIIGMSDEGHIEVACFNNSILLIEIISSDFGILSAKKYAQMAIPYIIKIQTPNEVLN